MRIWRQNRFRVALICLIASICFSQSLSALSTPWEINKEEKEDPESVNNRDGTVIRYLNLRIILGYSYLTGYSNGFSQAQNDLMYLHFPFTTNWSISFTKSYSSTSYSSLIMESCPNASGNACSCVSDGYCSNSVSTNYHHKNAVKNLSQIKSIFSSGYDLYVALVNGPLCYKASGNHYAVYGVTEYVGGKYAICDQLPTYTNIHKVRILQHEISHMFGCQDGVCSSGASCIMNGGYDNTSLYYCYIWCPSCTSDFNPNLH